jgi:hypothetical protein
MCEHTCCCILFIVMDGEDPKLRSKLECFWKEFENGFEIKERKEKKIRKKKEYKKLYKLFLKTY